MLINEGQRRIPVHHAKRVRSGRMYGGNTTFIPLKVNSAGMIPLIFAVSIMVFPGLIAQFLSTSSNETLRNFAAQLVGVYMSPNTLQYNIVYFLLVVAFTYFYTMVIFQQQKIAENLQRQGAFIPGVRPGRNTQLYLMRTLNRITLIGALFLGTVAILPFIAALIDGRELAVAGRDVAADRGRRGHRYHAPTRGPARDAQLRGLHQVGQAAAFVARHRP